MLSIRRNDFIYSLAILAIGVMAGAVVATVDYLAVIGAAIVGALIVIVMRARSTRSDATSTTVDVAIYVLLAIYLLPMLTLGRVYALVGHKPLYLADVLVMCIAVLALPHAFRGRMSAFSLLSLAVGLLMLHSVYVGYAQHYQGALRGLVMVIYPLAAIPIAAWLASRSDLERDIASFARHVLPFVPIGLAVVIVLHQSVIAASYGLYLGVVGAFAVVPGVPRRRLLLLACFIGLTMLISFSAKRGPALAIALGILAAWAASGSFRSHRSMATLALASLLSISVMALAASIGFVAPTRLPVVGNLIARVVDSRSNSSTEAANNVTLRTAMWAYALETTAIRGPFLGVGAFHPIEVSLYGNNIADDPESGVHNSFLGYAFYAGFPAGGLLIGLFVVGLWQTWRIRRTTIYAPALFGALVAVVVTALTNVALETTYIAGPSWLILAAAIGLAARYSNGPHSSSTVTAGLV